MAKVSLLEQPKNHIGVEFHLHQRENASTRIFRRGSNVSDGVVDDEKTIMRFRGMDERDRLCWILLGVA